MITRHLPMNHPRVQAPGHRDLERFRANHLLNHLARRVKEYSIGRLGFSSKQRTKYATSSAPSIPSLRFEFLATCAGAILAVPVGSKKGPFCTPDRAGGP